MHPFMRRRGRVPGLAAFFPAVIALSVASHAGPANTPGLVEKVDAIFLKWNKPDVPGCALGIQHQGAPPLFRAYGSADLEHGVPIDPTTVFEAGSVSKQFTAASTLILVEQGKLAFDDDVRKYIPELPDYGAAITIAQLLGHTSGLRDWEGVADIAGWPVTTRVYAVKDVLEVTARQKSLNYRPGTAFSYTNTGYILLATIVERVSGEPLAKFSSEHLFEPLGMTHTQWRDDFRRVVNGRAVAYDANPGGYHQLMPFENVFGAGGLLTTVGDLLKWNDALDAGALGRFVTTELQRESTLLDGQAISYARGLYVANYHGVRKIWHTGETAGYEAFLARYPDQHVSIALLCNTGPEANIDSLGDRLADLFLPTPGAPPPANQAPAGLNLTVEQLAPYAGLYFDARFVVQMQLEVKDGVLRRVTDGLVLTPIAPGEFRTTISTVRFSGIDRVVREFDDGRRWEFRRIRPWHPGIPELSEFAGRYRSDEAQATYEVNVVGGHLVIGLDDRRWDTAYLDSVSVDTFTKPHHAYHFIRDANGRVSSIEISNGWEHVYALSFQRVADVPELQRAR
ncbi:MAG TPA: serine hydrolase domain-containing protein [Rudaea sp.]